MEHSPLESLPLLRRASPRPQLHPPGVEIEWTTSLYSCGESLFPTAFMALCCPCVSLAQIASRLSGRGAYDVVLLLFLGLQVAGLTSVYVALPPRQEWFQNTASSSPTISLEFMYHHAVFEFEWKDAGVYCWGLISALIAFVRGYGRTKMHIRGNVGTDWLASCFCSSCTIAQLATQVDVYPTKEGSVFGPRDVLPQYVALEPRKSLVINHHVVVMSMCSDV
ncbi:Aste57867_19773 [Aphanomyces stellatus]|uniref:Aste57867_19773 protein n=1 Tax=Aphanomyces stellatus TaxID=120398 RepID=A0A485LHZ4_9STRA|nr:hypothetical protein As57867_019708 [Aphanomyces stellatus]VFT96471.1 Aste57867_19773 [Aphanomyces stellatus]